MHFMEILFKFLLLINQINCIQDLRSYTTYKCKKGIREQKIVMNAKNEYFNSISNSINCKYYKDGK